MVSAIVRQNFDWQMSGRANGVTCGYGAYFAADAVYSDRFTAPQKPVMFVARVLVDRYTTGFDGCVRPPPLDASRPFGDLYDSYVDNVERPNMFVVFDTDQCYPDYMITYRRNAFETRNQ